MKYSYRYLVHTHTLPYKEDYMYSSTKNGVSAQTCPNLGSRALNLPKIPSAVVRIGQDRAGLGEVQAEPARSCPGSGLPEPARTCPPETPITHTHTHTHTHTYSTLCSYLQSYDVSFFMQAFIPYRRSLFNVTRVLPMVLRRRLRCSSVPRPSPLSSTMLGGRSTCTSARPP